MNLLFPTGTTIPMAVRNVSRKRYNATKKHSLDTPHFSISDQYCYKIIYIVLIYRGGSVGITARIWSVLISLSSLLSWPWSAFTDVSLLSINQSKPEPNNGNILRWMMNVRLLTSSSFQTVSQKVTVDNDSIIEQCIIACAADLEPWLQYVLQFNHLLAHKSDSLTGIAAHCFRWHCEKQHFVVSGNIIKSNNQFNVMW